MYISSISDVTSVCPRNIANGHVRDDCNVSTKANRIGESNETRLLSCQPRVTTTSYLFTIVK